MNKLEKLIDRLKKILKKFPGLHHALSVLLFFSILYAVFFSPVLVSNKLLAPSDGFIYYLPAFYSARTLWTNLLLSGFPLAADPQIQTWYPISLIFSLIPNSWNAFVISAYVLASSFSYGYIYTLTQSRVASFVSGITYGMCGFMIAHLGHTSMIHVAAWIPLLIWALEKLRRSFHPSWVVLGVFAVSCNILAGHPQISVYTLALSTAYALILGWTALIGKWKYYGTYLTVISFGVALTAIQILPTAELSVLGLRSEMSFEVFNTYSLPPVEAVKLLFPYSLGGIYSSPPYKDITYFGTWGLAETIGYVGLLPLMLAVISLLSGKYKDIKISNFWLFVAIVTFLLTLGYATPLSWIVFHIPVYNKFRAPARHFIEVALAVSVLSGIGVAAIQQHLVSFGLLVKTIVASTGIMISVVLGLFLASGTIFKRIKEVSNLEEANRFSLLPWLNPAIGIPIVIFLLVVIALVFWFKQVNSKVATTLLLLILILDLASFGWFFEWKIGSPTKDLLTPTASIEKYRDILQANQQRLLPINGGISGNPDEIAPNMSMIWGVPTASGYGPLILSRVSQLLNMSPAGDVHGNWADPANRSLDIMATRYIFRPEPLIVNGEKGNSWLKEDLNLSLGSGCGVQQPQSVKLQVPPQIQANAIGIVCSLGCSVEIPNNAEVLNITATDAQGNVVTQSLNAGRDTSEWAYECSDVRPYMQHHKAPVFESFPVQRPSFPTCDGHKYVNILPLSQLSEIKNLNLEWVGETGSINIQKISLINETTKQTYPITEISGSTRWRYVENINKTQVYENLQVMPRAWLVPEVITAKPDEILNAIQSSKLPDGRTYNPAQVALVEKPLNFKAQNPDSTATAKIINLADTQLEIQTSSESPSFLVLSDVYYPGWQARIDGKQTSLYQTNYVLRGVQIPAGKHIVKFEFKPLSFHIGVGISTASLLFLGYLYWRFARKPIGLSSM